MKKLKEIKIATSVVIFTSCTNSFLGNFPVKQESGNMNAVTIYTSIPVGYDDKTILYYVDSMALIEYSNFRIFQFFSTHTFNLFMEQNEDGPPKLQQTIVTTKNKYFITRSDQKYGYYIDSATYSITGKNSVDSLYNKKSFVFSFYKLYDSHKKHSRLYSSAKDVREKTTIDKYVPIKKTDISQSDTMYYYFSLKKELTNIKFSLSPEQDTMGKGKMYKSVGKYIGDPNSENGFEQLERNIIIEMKPKKISNPEFIKKLCEKAEILFAGSQSISTDK